MLPLPLEMLASPLICMVGNNHTTVQGDKQVAQEQKTHGQPLLYIATDDSTTQETQRSF